MDKGILKFVGKEHYPWPQDHMNELRDQGPSVRIPPNAAPDLETPYPIVFVHPRGTFTLSNDMSLDDLYNEMVAEEHVSPDTDQQLYVELGFPTLLFIGFWRDLFLHDKKEYKRLKKKYGVQFHYAATHYSYITGVQVVIGDEGEGEGIVKDLERRGIEAEPVKVIPIDELFGLDLEEEV